jgi:hypothetical protein
MLAACAGLSLVGVGSDARHATIATRMAPSAATASVQRCLDTHGL